MSKAMGILIIVAILIACLVIVFNYTRRGMGGGYQRGYRGGRGMGPLGRNGYGYGGRNGYGYNQSRYGYDNDSYSNQMYGRNGRMHPDHMYDQGGGYYGQGRGVNPQAMTDAVNGAANVASAATEAVSNAANMGMQAAKNASQKAAEKKYEKRFDDVVKSDDVNEFKRMVHHVGYLNSLMVVEAALYGSRKIINYILNAYDLTKCGVIELFFYTNMFIATTPGYIASKSGYDYSSNNMALKAYLSFLAKEMWPTDDDIRFGVTPKYLLHELDKTQLTEYMVQIVGGSLTQAEADSRNKGILREVGNRIEKGEYTNPLRQGGAKYYNLPDGGPKFYKNLAFFKKNALELEFKDGYVLDDFNCGFRAADAKSESVYTQTSFKAAPVASEAEIAATLATEVKDIKDKAAKEVQVKHEKSTLDIEREKDTKRRADFADDYGVTDETIEAQQKTAMEELEEQKREAEVADAQSQKSIQEMFDEESMLQEQDRRLRELLQKDKEFQKPADEFIEISAEDMGILYNLYMNTEGLQLSNEDIKKRVESVKQYKAIFDFIRSQKLHVTQLPEFESLVLYSVSNMFAANGYQNVNAVAQEFTVKLCNHINSELIVGIYVVCALAGTNLQQSAVKYISKNPKICGKYKSINWDALGKMFISAGLLKI